MVIRRVLTLLRELHMLLRHAFRSVETPSRRKKRVDIAAMVTGHCFRTSMALVKAFCLLLPLPLLRKLLLRNELLHKLQLLLLLNELLHKLALLFLRSELLHKLLSLLLLEVLLQEPGPGPLRLRGGPFRDGRLRDGPLRDGRLRDDGMCLVRSRWLALSGYLRSFRHV